MSASFIIMHIIRFHILINTINNEIQFGKLKD